MERGELDWVGCAKEADAKIVIVETTHNTQLFIRLINNFLVTLAVSTSTALKRKMSN